MAHYKLQLNPAVITFYKLYTILIVAPPNSMLAEFCLECPLPCGDVGPGGQESPESLAPCNDQDYPNHTHPFGTSSS